jgi:hypothetical protein
MKKKKLDTGKEVRRLHHSKIENFGVEAPLMIEKR